MKSLFGLILASFLASLGLGCAPQNTVEIPENPATSFEVQPVDPPPKPARRP
jgi:hypothetical protein